MHCRLLFDLGGPGESAGAGQMPEELCAKFGLSSKFVLPMFSFQSLRTALAEAVPSVGSR